MCDQCDAVNSAMLSRIDSDEIKLIANDIADCSPKLKKKVMKLLEKCEKDTSRTAGLAKIITVKVGAKIVIRRNINIKAGLVNGAIATLKSFKRNQINNEQIDSITIQLSDGEEHILERCKVKFAVMNNGFVIREQFPISLCYGMTIHKSQGLSLKNAVVEVGNSVFGCGQTYVALSRVTSLDGLHIINLDPCKIQANSLAIVEYNRLQNIFRQDLKQINFQNKTNMVTKTKDIQWIRLKLYEDCQIPSKKVHNDIPNRAFRGLLNSDGLSCYANSVFQCIMHCKLAAMVFVFF